MINVPRVDNGIEVPETQAASRGALVLAVGIALFYLFADTRATLWDRDEPRFSRATAEMVETGDYLVPTFNGELRADKPILIYWLMSIPMRILGPTELACRFWSGVGTAVTCWLTFYIGSRLIGVGAGLWSMVILATSLMMLYMGTAATADGTLLPFMVAQVAVFVGFAGSTRRLWAQALLGLSLGGALLAKGPVGALPLLTPIALLALGRRVYPTRWRWYELVVATGLGLALFLWWALPANAATGGEFLRRGIGHHVLARSAQPLEHHGGRFLLYLPYYLPVILVGFFPWTLFLPATLSACLGARLGEARFRALFLAWTLPLLTVMTLVATKLPHYILFIWPVVALALAATIDASYRGLLTPADRRWLRRGRWLYVPMALLPGLALVLAPALLHAEELPMVTSLCGLVLIVEAVAVTWYLREEGLPCQAKLLTAGRLLFLLPFLLWVLPAIERLKVSPAVAQIVREEGGTGLDIATYGYAEPSLNFYIGRRLEHLATPAELVTWLDRTDGGLLIISEKARQGLAAEGVAIEWPIVASKNGFNYTKGERVEVHVLRR